MPASGALANIDMTTIIDRIAAGEYIPHIAKELGVTGQAIHYHLCKLPEYRQALQTRHQLRLDNAEERIESAPEAFDLARARESFRAAAWRAERECKAVWGASSELLGRDGGPLTVEIVRFTEGRTIDGEVGSQPIADAQSTAALPHK